MSITYARWVYCFCLIFGSYRPNYHFILSLTFANFAFSHIPHSPSGLPKSCCFFLCLFDLQLFLSLYRLDKLSETYFTIITAFPTYISTLVFSNTHYLSQPQKHTRLSLNQTLFLYLSFSLLTILPLSLHITLSLSPIDGLSFPFFFQRNRVCVTFNSSNRTRLIAWHNNRENFNKVRTYYLHYFASKLNWRGHHNPNAQANNFIVAHYYNSSPSLVHKTNKKHF